MNKEYAIEAILFAAGSPIKVKTLGEILGLSEKDVIQLADNLKTFYLNNKRGLNIVHINDCLQMCTNDEYGNIVRKALGLDIKQGLSQAALEVLAIIAYNQPITRVEIEKIRGVKSDKAINTLIEYNLIKENGRTAGPGRAILYITTEDFLRYFNIKSIEELRDLKVTP